MYLNSYKNYLVSVLKLLRHLAIVQEIMIVLNIMAEEIVSNIDMVQLRSEKQLLSLRRENAIGYEMSSLERFTCIRHFTI